MQTNNHSSAEQMTGSPNQNRDEDSNKFSQSIPPLGVNSSKAVNKKGLIFIGIVGLIGLAAVFWMVSKSGAEKKAAKSKAEKEEVVVIPERKVPLPAAKPAPAAVSPIPLATDAKAGAPDLSKDPKALTIEQRRGSDSLVVQAYSDKNNSGESSKAAAASFAGGEEGRALIQRRSSDGGDLSISTGGASGSPAAATTNAPSAPGKGGGNATASNSNNLQGVANAVAFPVQAARNIPLSPDLSILQGSAIRCLMNTRLISDIAGQVVCTVTDNVLSTSAKRVLIPKGTKVIGDYGGKVIESLDRVGIIWNRLITPDNIDIALMSPGTDPLGSAGVPGYVDEKWRLRLGAAVLITLASDIMKVGVQTYGPRTTVRTTDSKTGQVSYEEVPFDSATVKMIEKAPQPYLNRVLNAPPTVIIQQGTLVSIQTAKDMDFSDVYENK